MWTKIAKVSLVLFLIGGFIYSIILGSTADWSLWWIIPIGWILTFLSASTIGTVVEISDKASENQYMLEELTTLVKSRKKEPTVGSQVLQSHISPSVPTNVYPSTPWRCPDCGESNDKHAQYCKNCGRYR